MQELSPKARFDALAGLLQFDAACVDAIRGSINHLLREVSELVRMVDEAMKRDEAAMVLGDLGGERREKLQSLLASFIMRTINCNFDDEYCSYAHDISHSDDVPPGLFAVGLTLAHVFVTRTLTEAVEDHERLARMLTAWSMLTSILKEITRKP